MRSASRSNKCWVVSMVIGLLLSFFAMGAWADDVPVTADSLNAGTVPTYSADDTLKITGSLTTTTPGGGWNTLKGLTVPFHLELDNATTTIPYDAMNGSAVKSITANAATNIGNYAFQSTNLTAVSLPAATTIGEGAFGDCTSLTAVSLPVATTIGNSTFYDCTNLETVSLPAATTIGESAFSNCTNLETVSLPTATPVLTPYL